MTIFFFREIKNRALLSIYPPTIIILFNSICIISKQQQSILPALLPASIKKAQQKLLLQFFIIISFVIKISLFINKKNFYIKNTFCDISCEKDHTLVYKTNKLIMNKRSKMLIQNIFSNFFYYLYR